MHWKNIVRNKIKKRSLSHFCGTIRTLTELVNRFIVPAELHGVLRCGQIDGNGCLEILIKCLKALHIFRKVRGSLVLLLSARQSCGVFLDCSFSFIPSGCERIFF